MSDKVLQLEEVTKSIKTQTIVQPISFSLEPGDVLALCGGNGAGKSTILRMITGIVKPTAGTIRVNGLQWAKDRKTYADSIGYMPDDFQFGDALTAQETLQFYASLRNAPKERVTELLQMTGLKEFGHKKVSAYSKGMRQRLLFAQAMTVVHSLNFICFLLGQVFDALLDWLPVILHQNSGTFRIHPLICIYTGALHLTIVCRNPPRGEHKCNHMCRFR